MPETNEVEVSKRVVTTKGTDPVTRWLLWGIVAVLLMLAALIAYALMTGSFSNSGTPRTAEEDALLTTAQAIRANPKDGQQYAIRAETLHTLGRKAEAYQVLSQGESVVATAEPALLYILRTRTSLLNADGKYVEAEKVGHAAMTASDDYLGLQGLALARKSVTNIDQNLRKTMSVDTAIQLAAAYMGEKKYAKAIEMYTYSLKLDPLAADVMSLRGTAYLVSGDKVKAKADFVEALKYLPDDSGALAGMKQLSK